MRETDTCLFYFVSISVTLFRLFYVNPLRVSVCFCSHLLASALSASHGFNSRVEFWSSAAERTQLSLPARRRANKRLLWLPRWRWLKGRCNLSFTFAALLSSVKEEGRDNSSCLFYSNAAERQSKPCTGKR